LLVAALVSWPRDGARADIPMGGGEITEAEVEARGLLGEWLGAQNQYRFDRYAALYAASFRHVRRSGTRQLELDRDAWLADRKPMFRMPMAVWADKVVVTIAPSIALRFTLYFRAGDGWAFPQELDGIEEHMELVVEGGKLRIAREEVLASTPAR